MDANFAFVTQENVFESSQKHFCFKDANVTSATYVSQFSQALTLRKLSLGLAYPDLPEIKVHVICSHVVCCCASELQKWWQIICRNLQGALWTFTHNFKGLPLVDRNPLGALPIRQAVTAIPTPTIFIRPIKVWQWTALLKLTIDVNWFGFTSNPREFSFNWSVQLRRTWQKHNNNE